MLNAREFRTDRRQFRQDEGSGGMLANCSKTGKLSVGIVKSCKAIDRISERMNVMGGSIESIFEPDSSCGCPAPI